MKFRNYCIVVMGKIDAEKIKTDIQRLSETEINVLDAKGILIATFSSLLDPVSITDFFLEHDISFLVFDLDVNSSGVNITKKEYHDGLFGFLEHINTAEMDENFLKIVNQPSNNKKTKLAIKPKTSVPKNLNEQLNDAINNEDYEAAAILRDKINNEKVK